MKQYEYEVVSGWDIESIQDRVRAHLSAGWACEGGITKSIDAHGAMYYQAMTRVTDTDKSSLLLEK